MSNIPFTVETADVEAEVTYLTTEQGGRKKPAFSGYRPQFVYDGRHWDAIHLYPGKDYVLLGETASVYLSFMSPHCHVGRLYPGKEFSICEGPRVVANGRITRIINLEASAKAIGNDVSECDW